MDRICVVIFNMITQIYIPLHISLRLILNEPKHVADFTVKTVECVT